MQPGWSQVILVGNGGYVCRRAPLSFSACCQCSVQNHVWDRGIDILRFVRGHWTIENNVHWVRDTAWREDASKIRTGAAPRIMASLRNAVWGVLALKGQHKITENLRRMAWKADRAITLVMQAP